MDYSYILPYAQIVLSVILIVLVLMQHSDASSGGAFGQSDNWSNSFHTRRGAENVIFIITIIVAVLFAATSFVALLIR